MIGKSCDSVDGFTTQGPPQSSHEPQKHLNIKSYAPFTLSTVFNPIGERDLLSHAPLTFFFYPPIAPRPCVESNNNYPSTLIYFLQIYISCALDLPSFLHRWPKYPVISFRT